MKDYKKNIRSGQFARYTQQKKWKVWNRLRRYARQLGIKIKAPVAAACLAAGLSFAIPATAQTFAIQTGGANPFDGINSPKPAPAFVDIDGDGDKDVFIGNYYGNITYYKNTGTPSEPNFVLQAGTANPLNNVTDAYNSAPAFADIDGDGDMDAFIGLYDGTILYYKNTGSATAPVFEAQAGTANPFNNLNVSGYSTPSFVDIDGDGDIDAFIGAEDGTISYFKIQVRRQPRFLKCRQMKPILSMGSS